MSTANSYELVGKVAFVRALHQQATLGAFISAIRAMDGLNPAFLYYQLSSAAVQQSIRDTASTTTNISNVSTKKLGSIRVRIAPCFEQERIALAIDEQFSRLDAAVSVLRRVQANLKRYRAAVLNAACAGQLVSTEAELARQEERAYEAADVLLSQVIAERRSRLGGRYKVPVEPDTQEPFALPEGWQWITLDSILGGIEAGRSFRCEERPPHAGEVGVVKVSAVTWGEFNEEESKTCVEPDRINPEYLIRVGDFLFSRANTINLVGACVITRVVRHHLMLSDKILRFHIIGVPLKWILFCLRSPFGRAEIERLATGNQDSMRNIGQERIRQIRIPLPPLSEINRIVTEVERRLSAIGVMEAAVEKDLRRAGRLRQSILKRAFEGKLVPQDPNDEPASALLERIRASRAGETPTSKPKRARRTAKAAAD